MKHSKSFTFKEATSPVYIFGTGKNSILVLHGWGSSIKSWQTVLSQIDSNKFTTYFLELPGFGQSTPPKSGWYIKDYLEFVQNFLKEFKLNPEYLLVHSFGGRIAIKWLSTSNHSFKKAIFIGAAGIKPKLTILQKLFKTTTPKFKKLSTYKFTKPIYNFCKKIVYKLLKTGDYDKAKGPMKQTFLNTINEDLTSQLSKINIPVHLLWGAKDSYTPVWMAHLMHQEIPNSTLNVLSQGKHGIHLQNPDILVQEITKHFTD